MLETGIIFSKRYLFHNPGFNHPESPKRLHSLIEGIKYSGFLESGICSIIEPRPASYEELRLVHNLDYINLVKRISESGGGILDQGDTVASLDSFNVASLAVGGSIKAVEMILNGFCRNVFALVRPPGHHAGSDYPRGFCIFNNVAVAAASLINNFGLDRVIILDIDAHHGNGTQEIFYGTRKVLYISIHQNPKWFPGTGFTEETGEDEGLGFTINIPLPLETSDRVYWMAIKEIVMPIANQYKPQFVLVSAGFDGYYNDPVAGLTLSAGIYPRIFNEIMKLANRHSGGRIVSILEGGYATGFLRKVIVSVLSKMLGRPHKINALHPAVKPRVQNRAKKVINKVKTVQSCFWSL